MTNEEKAYLQHSGGRLCGNYRGGLGGCGTKTIIVQSTTENNSEISTENNSVQQQSAATAESNAGALSKKDSEIPTTAATTEAPKITTAATTDAASNKGEYFFYDSDKRLLTEADLEGMSVNDMRLARNEIFARHGRKFNDEKLQSYFNSKSWYTPTVEPAVLDADVERYLNSIEIKNTQFIKSVEDKYNGNTEGYSDEELKKKVIAHYKSNYKNEGYEEKLLAYAEDFVYNGDGTGFEYTEIRSMGNDVVVIDMVEDHSDKDVALAYPSVPWVYYIKRSTGKGKIVNRVENEVKEVDISGF